MAVSAYKLTMRCPALSDVSRTYSDSSARPLEKIQQQHYLSTLHSDDFYNFNNLKGLTPTLVFEVKTKQKPANLKYRGYDWSYKWNKVIFECGR